MTTNWKTTLRQLQNADVATVPSDEMARACAEVSYRSLVEAAGFMAEGSAGAEFQAAISNGRAWADLARAYAEMARNDR